MISIKPSLGPFQAFQLQVAARGDPSAKNLDDTQARDALTDNGQTAIDLDLSSLRTLPDTLPKAHHVDFLTQMDAIMTANSAPDARNNLSTDAARLQALQVRQQLELQPNGMTNRASQLALALFR